MSEKNPLDYTPPKGIPNISAFGGTIPDDIYESECIGYRINDRNPDNAWIEFTNQEFPDEGRFSMNLWLPTQNALRQKAAQLKQDGKIPEDATKEQVIERTLKAFFHYGQTMKVAGVSEGTPIEKALEALKGWKGKASYTTSKQTGKTIVEKILSAKDVRKAAVATSQSMVDVPF